MWKNGSIEMLEMASRHDARRALSLAPGLAHVGLQSLAQVAIGRGLLDETRRTSTRSEP